MMSARAAVLLGLCALVVLALPTESAAQRGGQQKGPVIIPRDPSDPSIHEGPSGRRRAGYKEVEPLLGLLPASYTWFGGLVRAIGSIVQPFAADPRYAGYQSGQRVGFDFFYRSWYKPEASPDIRPGDIPRLGQACGSNPGDPYWVGFPRPGNVEFPPPFQIFRHPWDCYCRCNERIACPVPGPNLHRIYGGLAGNVPCQTCFPTNILKHDRFVGTDHGVHLGYSISDPADTGFQECLRQSIESYAGSGPGRSPRAPFFGL